jgi:hypothetical protein
LTHPLPLSFILSTSFPFPHFLPLSLSCILTLFSFPLFSPPFLFLYSIPLSLYCELNSKPGKHKLVPDKLCVQQHKLLWSAQTLYF